MDLTRQLRECGLRATLVRVNVLKLLYEFNCEVSADDLYKKFRDLHIDISLTTIYKTLSELESKKIVRCIFLGRNKNFFKLNNDLVYCNIVSSKTHEPVYFDKSMVQEKLKQFIQTLDMDIESAELIIYKK